MLIVSQLALVEVKYKVCSEEDRVCYHLRHIKLSYHTSLFEQGLLLEEFCF